MDNNSSNSNGVLIGIIIVVIIAIVGWLAYRQGVFTGGAASTNNDSAGVQINLPGSGTGSNQ